MKIIYRQAFTEVLEVLKHTSQIIVKKIPENFIMFLNENKDDDYVAKIDFSKTDWENDVKEETQAILGLIYRDYIVSPKKRSELIKKEDEDQTRIENEIREKYNSDNIFKKEENETVVQTINIPVEIKKETFFNKIINFIKGIFKK